MGTKIKQPTNAIVHPVAIGTAGAAYIRHALHLRIFNSITPKRALLAAGIAIFLFTSGLALSFYAPRAVAFSYTHPTCITNPIVLPNMIQKQRSRTFQASLKNNISIAGYPLYSHTTCITPIQPPIEKQTETIVLGALVKKSIRVTPDPLPTIKNSTQLSKPIPAKEHLAFTLDYADQLFLYRLSANSRTASCIRQQRQLICDLAPLSLSQSTQYTLTLQRLFAGKTAGMVLQHAITTVDAIRVTHTSIAADQTLYDAPTEITVTFNKPIATYSGVRLYLVSDDSRQDIPISIEIKDTILTARFNQPLARSASFLFSLEQITAPDGSYLPDTVSLPFKTSGGPKVLGVNIGSYKIQPTGSIVVTFDTNLSPTQPGSNFIRIESGGSTIASTVIMRGKTATITPVTALARCTPVVIRVTDGLQNEFGIAGGSAWRFHSRVICQTVFSIGTSVQGRNITAYKFGSGPSKIIFVGTMHGDEKSATYLLNSWIEYLEANGDQLPGHRTIIIIPTLNPDGYTASSRTNAHGVDLNRNFPSDDWKPDVTMPDQSFRPGAGGSAPLSEPESSSLANYIAGQGPSLVLTYHAVAGVVVPNDAGSSGMLAHTYDQKSNVYFTSNSATGTVFPYDTTGALETWLHDKPGIAALLIELWTSSGNEFSKHQAAMWAMTQSP